MGFDDFRNKKIKKICSRLGCSYSLLSIDESDCSERSEQISMESSARMSSRIDAKTCNLHEKSINFNFQVDEKTNNIFRHYLFVFKLMI